MPSSPPGPIHGYVPSDPPSDTNKPKLPNRKGWPKGKPRKNGLVAMPKEGEPGCPTCGRAIAELTMPVLAELVRMLRDRVSEEQDVASDLLYVAARVDGFCSTNCWGTHGAFGSKRPSK